MIAVNSKTPVEAWKKSLSALYLSKELHDERSKDLFRDCSMALELENPLGDSYDNLFPMTQNQIKIINDYLVSGSNKQLVTHEWTKKYRERLFEEDNQIERITEYLRNNPQGKKAVASLWNSSVDFHSEISPCLQLLWFQVRGKKLELHVHMRACDCYGKLLMNINEFVALQKYVAKKLEAGVGAYIMFIDSLHFNLKDKETIENIVKKIKE